MAHPSAERIAQRAFDVGLLDELELQKIWAELGSRTVSSDEFIQMMVRRELMTNYQLERLLSRKKSGFFFGDYKILYFVGEGSFARVYRAAHRETGQVVAVKVLRTRFSRDHTQFGRFVREGELGETLRHPNIVPVYEVSSRDQNHYLVMEFVEGWNLREFVKVRKKLEPVEATRLMMDIAAGLRYAFDQGLAHRDLKLNNVLVSSRGRAKLVDFGLASPDASGRESRGEKAVARTIDYAALERATGVERDDGRSDLYFLGCMFYHILTGVSPLVDTKDRSRRMSKSRFMRIKPILERDSSLPHSVAAVVSKAMELDPERRYQNPALMLTDLVMLSERLSGGDEAGELSADDAEETDKERRERKRLVALAAKNETNRSVMVVESNSHAQDVFRKGLKRAGYRALVMGDPRRVLERFRQEPSAADCLIFNAQHIGRTALDTFNRFGDDNIMRTVPAILLLGEGQKRWKKQANTTAHRVVLSMPISLKKLRRVLSQLIEPETESES